MSLFRRRWLVDLYRGLEEIEADRQWHETQLGRLRHNTF
jgi:hypothetical protein